MQAAIDKFLVQVKAIEKTIELRDDLVALGQVLPGQLNSTAVMLRRSVRRIGLAGMQPSLDGSVLLLVAAFEQFVSDLMIAFAAKLPDIVSAYNDLPHAIRSANERFTGEALSRSHSRFTEYDLRRFVINLRDCHAGTVPYVLNGEAMAMNDRNLKVGPLQNLFSRLGVQDIWNTVASTQILKRWSGPGGANTAKSRAKNQLNELIDNRNQIAHRVGTTTLGPQAMRSYIRFERVLARSLVKGLENYASSL